MFVRLLNVGIFGGMVKFSYKTWADTGASVFVHLLNVGIPFLLTVSLSKL